MYIENPVNCWKAKSKDMLISSQASDMRKVQRLSVKTEYAQVSGNAGGPVMDRDIVWSYRKL